MRERPQDLARTAWLLWLLATALVAMLSLAGPAEGGRRGGGAGAPPLQETLQLALLGDSRGLEESTDADFTAMVNWARDQRAVECRNIAGIFHSGDLEGATAAPNADRAGQGTALQALPFWFNWSLVPSHSDSSNAAGIPPRCPGGGCNADRFIADIGNAAQGVTWDGPNFHTSFTVPVGGVCASGYDSANVRAVVHRFPFGRSGSGVGVFTVPWDGDCVDVVDAQLTTYVATFPNDVIVFSTHGALAGGGLPLTQDAQFDRDVDNCLTGSATWTNLRRLWDTFPIVFVAASHCPTNAECFTTTSEGGLAVSGCTQDYAGHAGVRDDDGDLMVLELSCATDTVKVFQVDPIDSGAAPAPCEWDNEAVECCAWVDPDGSPPGYGTPIRDCNAESWTFPADLKARGVC